MGYYLAEKKRVEEELRAKQEKSLGTPALGGPFTLVDQNGRPVTSSTFRGSYMLIYFGFTFCPDICPEELRKMSAVVDCLARAERGKNLQPIFITLDPWRDSVAQMKMYCKEFHPRLVGLTGTPEQIRKVAKEYRVYSSKAPSDAENDYLVDHSIIMYLMDSQGKFLAYFGKDKTQEQITAKLLELGV